MDGKTAVLKNHVDCVTKKSSQQVVCAAGPLNFAANCWECLKPSEK